MLRRTAETRAVAWWCEARRDDPHAYSRDVIALGDFNMPKAEPGDRIYDELQKGGLRVPKFESRIGTDAARAADFADRAKQGEKVPEGSTISGASQYDQFVISPEYTGVDIQGDPGVFDFDAVLFADLWDALPWHRANPTPEERKRTPEYQRELDFDNYVRWSISDHRPVWLRLKINN
jgi:hypothetical protein